MTTYEQCLASALDADGIHHNCYRPHGHDGDHVCQGEAGARVGCYHRWAPDTPGISGDGHCPHCGDSCGDDRRSNDMPPQITHTDEARRVCVAQASRAIEQADNTGDPMAALLGLHSLLRSSGWADLEADL